MESKNQVGRPLKFKSVEELQRKIDAYFKEMDDKKKPYTITGLALALDTSREILVKYEQRSEFADTVKRAKLKCENYAEESLFTSRNTAGVIFNMKNNYSWTDKQEIVNINQDSLEGLTEEELDAKIKALKDLERK